jgi:adenylate cyclase
MPVTTATAAVLFTDMVGSTDLLSRLGEAAFDGLRRDHFADLREALDRTGGTEVKSTGDGVLATFTCAGSAIGCAVAMQQSVARLGASSSLRLAIRVGLALGDVSFEDGDVFGAPVIEAARLVAAAGGGQILATAVVRLVAGRRSEAVFTDLGCLALRGLPTPVPTCEVAWEPDHLIHARAGLSNTGSRAA